MEIKIRGFFGDWREVTEAEADKYFASRARKIPFKDAETTVNLINRIHIRGKKYTVEDYYRCKSKKNIS